MTWLENLLAHILCEDAELLEQRHERGCVAEKTVCFCAVVRLEPDAGWHARATEMDEGNDKVLTSKGTQKIATDEGNFAAYRGVVGYEGGDVTQNRRYGGVVARLCERDELHGTKT